MTINNNEMFAVIGNDLLFSGSVTGNRCDICRLVLTVLSKLRRTPVLRRGIGNLWILNVGMGILRKRSLRFRKQRNGQLSVRQLSSCWGCRKLFAVTWTHVICWQNWSPVDWCADRETVNWSWSIVGSVTNHVCHKLSSAGCSAICCLCGALHAVTSNSPRISYFNFGWGGTCSGCVVFLHICKLFKLNCEKCYLLYIIVP